MPNDLNLSITLDQHLSIHHITIIFQSQYINRDPRHGDRWYYQRQSQNDWHHCTYV